MWMIGKSSSKRLGTQVITSGLLQIKGMKQAQQVPEIQSAHAILILDGNYLLQLRDDKADISAPGKWSLFGGRKNVEETPLQTIRREVYEELAIESVEFSYLWFDDHYAPFERTVIRSWFFVSDVTSVWPGHKLREGEAVQAFTFEQLEALDISPIMRQTLERFHRMGQRKD